MILKKESGTWKIEYRNEVKNHGRGSDGECCHHAGKVRQQPPKKLSLWTNISARSWKKGKSFSLPPSGRKRERLKMRFMVAVREDIQMVDVSEEDVVDRVRWRQVIHGSSSNKIFIAVFTLLDIMWKRNWISCIPEIMKFVLLVVIT